MTRRKQSYDDADLFLEQGLHIPTRTIYIGSATMDNDNNEDGVNFALAEKVIKGLHVLESSSQAEITCIINSIGGDTYQALAIYDAIKACKSPVKMIAYGNIFSAAGYILQSADRRIVSKNSALMLHDGAVSYSGTPRSVDNWREFEKKQDRIFFEIYFEKIREKHPKFKSSELEEYLKFDTIWDSEQILYYNLADEVLE